VIDPAAQRATKAAICVVGVCVTFQRLTGMEPNVVTTSAEVRAVVRLVTPDGEAEAQTNYSGSKPGGITQDDRFVMVMACDLAEQGFPLPVIKGDRVVLDPSTQETAEVTKVDYFRRAIAGAIELTVTGVA
jgi:hypothetical protein